MQRDEEAPLADLPQQMPITFLESFDVQAVDCGGLSNWNFLGQLQRRKAVDIGGKSG